MSSYADVTDHCDRNLDFIFWIVNGVVGASAVVVNSFTCAVFTSSEQLRDSAMNCFLFSLSVSDVVLAMFVAPCFAVFCSGCSYIPGSDYCWVFEAGKDFALLASLSNLLAITYDRYVAVLQPLRYNTKMSTKRVYVLLATVWCVPLVFALARTVWLSFSTSEERHESRNQIHSDVLVVAFTFTPVIIMTAVNLRILKTVRCQSARIHASAQGLELHRREPSLSFSTRRKSELKARLRKTKGTLSCIVIIAVFIVCWLPRAYYQICFQLLKRPDLLSPLAIKLTFFFLFLQSSVNPFVYSFYRSEFRRAAKKLLKFCGE